MKYFLFLTTLICIETSLAQRNNPIEVKNSKFPNAWDKNRNLRMRNGKVLAWVHKLNGRGAGYRSCILLVQGTDSSGKAQYFISEMYTDKKPFDKWNQGWIHYGPNLHDTTSKFQIGYFDVHIEKFSHVPAEKELYDLLFRWKFSFFDASMKTIEAGIDKQLWLSIFGFEPEVKKFSKTI